MSLDLFVVRRAWYTGVVRRQQLSVDRKRVLTYGKLDGLRGQKENICRFHSSSRWRGTFIIDNRVKYRMHIIAI